MPLKLDNAMRSMNHHLLRVCIVGALFLGGGCGNAIGHTLTSSHDANTYPNAIGHTCACQAGST